ncbi:sulfotransferase domain-containing protein [Chthonobacter albigriseus]|uniref:sulfotransferase domain-containing protein n=1 Tax=Chthonobacter albigriseus TaxID=1683161 RepID=UPI0015EE3D4C|nr:sulfotransferase domain-containing protein [Chthonobacter albigriseus]
MLDRLDLDLEYTHADTGTRFREWGKHFTRLNIGLSAIPARQIIFLTRDPRDVAVSMFYQMTHRQRPPLRKRIEFALTGRTPPRNISGFVRHPGFGFEKVVRFNVGWAELLRSRRDVLFVTYEALHADTKSELTRVVDFLGQSRTADQIVGAVTHCSFERMRKQEQINALTGQGPRWLQPGHVDDPLSYKTRRGKTGEFVDEVAPDDLAYFDRVLERYDYRRRMTAILGRSPLAEKRSSAATGANVNIDG